MTAAGLCTKEILVVEDDQDISESFRDLLEAEGYSVTLVSNGQEAIDTLKAHSIHPSVIFLDLMMPIKDGFQFREEQMSDLELQKIPVVIMSADGHVQEKLLRTKATTYLKKPLAIETVLTIAKRFCCLDDPAKI
jgi:CheY-like chemotaxis protein